MKVYKPPTITSAVKEVFPRLENGAEFSGIEFKALCVRKNPKLKNVYEDTFMRLLRKYFRNEFICVNRHKSRYKKIAK